MSACLCQYLCSNEKIWIPGTEILCIHSPWAKFKTFFSKKWAWSQPEKIVTSCWFLQINMRRAAGRGYSYFHSHMCVSMYNVFHASWPNEKRYGPEIWYTHSTLPYLKTVFSFFFSKKWRWGPVSSKNCGVKCHFPHISPRLPCFIFFFFFWSLTNLCHTSWPHQKITETWISISKKGFVFFGKVTLSFGKLPCHVDFPHISSIALSKSPWGEHPAEDIPNFTCTYMCVFIYVFEYLCHVSWPNEKRYRPEI